MWALCLHIIIFGCLLHIKLYTTVRVISAGRTPENSRKEPPTHEELPGHPHREDASVGKEFLLAVTKQNRAGTFIYVSCATDTTINVFAPHVNLNETHQIISGTHKIIPLDNRLMNEKHQIDNKGVYVTADNPISIYVIENIDFSLIDALIDAEGYLALPISAISTEYVIATDSANSTMCQIVIAALENDTIVNVTFKTIGNITINDMQYSSGNVFSLKMSKLDTFQVQHIHDITGTFLQSNEPIAVFSGCICGYGPAKGTCQHEVEQIVPVHSLGQEYITVPLFPSASYRYRIVSPFNNNIVSIQGKDYMIESGNFLERWDTEPIYIHASKPVMVIEYGQCTDAKCHNGSDPSMIIIPSISAFSINFTFEQPENLSTINIHFYLLVTIRTNRVNDLMLDRKRLNFNHRYTVTTDPREEYTILVTNITSGYHKLHHPDPSVRYGAVLYGTGQKKSIGFFLGYHTDPSKPNVTVNPTGTQNIRLIITIVSGQAAGYEIIAVSYANGNIYKQKGKFLPNERKSIYDFTSTDLPGTCFNFSVVATIGSGQWVSSSEPINAPNVCYDPSKPNVTVNPTGTQNIRLIITIVSGQAAGYEIIAVSYANGNINKQKGKFLPNERKSIYDFTSTDLPGTCFNFSVVATIGSGQWVSSSEPINAPNVCYDPSKPNVTVNPTGTQNIWLIITIVSGQAAGYEIIAVSYANGNIYKQKGKFLPNERKSIYDFTSTDLPGTCFNFSVVATIGSGQWVSSSEPINAPNVCYVTGNLSKPLVRSEIQLLTMERNQLVFHCDFDPSSDLSMLYQVTWYRDKLETESKLMSSKHTLYSSKENFRSQTYLPEIDITLGMTIFCAISAIQLNITVTSEPYFVGFEVISNNSLKLKDLEETVVYIRLTVPFGCQRQSEECFLGVNIFLETGVDECLLPAAAALSSCGVKISSWRWNQSYPLRIAVKHGQNLDSISRTNNIRFRTDENFYHDFFRNYTLPKNIQVEVNTDASNLNGKECHAICDPHMQTFDGRKYENQNEGTYILYKHLKSPVQVQMRTNPCYGVPPDGPFCPCGVAVSSGRDVFVVDRCSKPIKIYMPQCDDGTLKGKIKSAGNFYQIYLSTGTWVKITSGISFNIYIYPYISDRKSTSGLCGYLDGDVQNDFMLRNGTTVPKEKFEDFNSHWLVKPEEDLFNDSNYKFLPRWPREDYLCMCGQYQDGHIVQPQLCSPDTRNFCPENVLNDSLAAECNINHRIKENAGIELDPSDFDVSQNENDTLTEIQTKRNFTKESANFECWSYLNRSLLFKKCSEIPDIHPESFIEMCVMDAMLTNTTFWTPTHLDHAQKRCIHQVTVNQPIPEQIIKKYNVASNSLEQVSNQTTNGTGIYTANLLQNLRDLACPMNCTGQGDCIKGQCRCYKGYGSEDCSVDMNKAPKVYGIPNRGVCDLQETRCDRVSVLGEDFTNSQHLSCRLSIFQVQVNETRFEDYNSIVVQARWISFAEVSCPIVDTRSKRSVQFPDDLDTLAIGYRVAVGNTREIFGRDISLLVVDSLCVDCIKAGFNITCTLKDGFDLINKRCIRKMSAGNKTESGSTVLIISTVVGSVLVMIVVGMLLHYCLVARIRRAQYEKDKKEKAYAELQEINKNNDYYGNMEEVYDEIGDLPDDYASISESVPTKNELK